MSTNEFRIIDRTDVGVVTVYSIEERFAARTGLSRRNWTLVCNPESGDDLVIAPSGTHYADLTNLPAGATAVRQLVEWVVNDGWKEF